MVIGDRLAVLPDGSSRRQIPPTKLRAIVQHFVVELETHMVLYQAAQESSCTRSGSDNYREYTEFDNGFFAILGVSREVAPHMC